MEKMIGFLKDRGKRSLMAAVGLLICAVGAYLQMQANIGMSPWDALNQGLSMKFGITYGTASISVALLVIVFDLMLKERIGIGTFLDAFLVGSGVDFCVSTNLVPVQTSLPGQLGCLLIGIVIVCFGQVLYMKAGLSCGPRDSFMVGLGKRVSKVPIGFVNIAIFATVLAICIPLGSPIGLGTVICAFGTGIIMEGVFRMLHFKPRKVVHESIFETCAEFLHVMGVVPQKHKHRTV